MNLKGLVVWNLRHRNCTQAELAGPAAGEARGQDLERDQDECTRHFTDRLF